MVIEIKTDKPYEVIVEDGVLDRAGEKIAPLVRPGSRAMIVSESNVFPIYGERLKASLEKAGIHTAEFVFEAGEPQKQLSTVMQIYEALAENDFTRSDIIVTLGGGVAGDMGGFAAATFLRGIDFVQVPTSLLAQVDASVGGKTGVDLPFGKNLVGAFHQPRLVLADPQTLSTLPDAYFTDGMGEVKIADVAHGMRQTLQSVEGRSSFEIQKDEMEGLRTMPNRQCHAPTDQQFGFPRACGPRDHGMWSG